MAPMPDAKLHLFFKKDKLGPYRDATASDFGPKSPNYHEMVQVAFNAWTVEQADETVCSKLSKAVASAQTVREKEVNGKKRSRLEIARSTGVEAIKRKKAQGDIIAD